MKIKTWFVLIIAVTVSSILLIQGCFYTLFRRWNISMNDSLIEGVTAQSAKQILDLYASVEDIAFEISTAQSVQDYIYTYNNQERFSQISTLYDNISSIIFASKNIKYVAILQGNDVLLDVSQAMEHYTCLSVLAKVLPELPDEGLKGSFVDAYQHDDKSYFAYVNRIFSTTVGMTSPKPYSIVILFELGGVDQYLEPVFSENKYTLTVLNQAGKVLASDDASAFGTTFELEEHAKYFQYKTYKMDRPQWQIVLSAPKANFLSSNLHFSVFMVVVIILGVLLLIFMIYILINNISTSISEVAKEIDIICQGEWEHRIHYERKNEIGHIVKNFNVLLDQYDAMNRKNMQITEQMHRERLLQLYAQIDHLQEKISPHFLYNSMEHIKGVAMDHNVPEIADITCVLSNIFRYNLSDSKSATIEDELSYALSYFNVINARKKYPIRLKIDLSPEIMKQQIIKMVFQPILENILKHADLGQGGLVEFSGSVREDGYTEIAIRDNGRGISEEKLAELQRTLSQSAEEIKESERDQHVGLLNIHTRLHLYYGSDCGLTVKSREGQGTEILIRIRH